jgi:hypothetical protein
MKTEKKIAGPVAFQKADEASQAAVDIGATLVRTKKIIPVATQKQVEVSAAVDVWTPSEKIYI